MTNRESNFQEEEKQTLHINEQVNNDYETLKKLDLDCIIDDSGYNYFTYKIIFTVFGIIVVDGIQMTLFSSMIIPFKDLFKIPDYGIQLVSCILFVGVGLGSLIAGNFSKRWRRPVIINIYLGIILLCTILSALFLNFILFGILRFIIGFLLGMVIPLSINLLTECLPIKNRSLVITSIWAGFILGMTLSQIVMLFSMPELESSSIKSTLLYLALIQLIFLIISILFLEDSPRNLILRNFPDEAFDIIYKLNSQILNETEKERVISGVNDGLNKQISNELKEIFNPKFFYLTIILTFLSVIISIVIFGPYMITSLTLKMLGKDTITSNSQIIIDQIKISAIGLPFILLGGFLTEIKFFGRLKSMIVVSFLALFTIILFIIFPKTYSILFGSSQSLLSISFNISTTYTCEAYPTKIRDYAVGFILFSTRVGGIVSQFLYYNLNYLGMWVPYYVTIGLLVVMIILIYLLPFDTYGKPLDVDNEKLSQQEKIR